VNLPARIQEVAGYLCPSDISTAQMQDRDTKTGVDYPMGRSNYFGNMGTNGYVAANRNGSVGGIFYYDVDLKVRTKGYRPTAFVRIADVRDGTSNTAMFAEIRRGNNTAGTYDPQDTRWGFGGWDDLRPVDACNRSSGSALRYTGLQYYRNLISTSLYTHTVPPNNRGGDCAQGPPDRPGDIGSFFAMHVAARSYHPGGVNVAFADGSVHFVHENIDLTVWRNLGTRAGGELVDTSSY